MKKVENLSNLEKKFLSQKKKIQNLESLLSSLNHIEDQVKTLWIEIYENASLDRERAEILYSDLMLKTLGNISHHTINGPILAKYLERMCRSNEQILKLAEIINQANESDGVFEKNDIFSKIRKKEMN